MPGRKIRDEADARRCLRSFEDSGLTLVEWAREYAVDGRSLHGWRLNLQRRALVSEPAQPTMRLVELVADQTTQDLRSCPTKPRYVVRIAGAEVEVGDDFKEETLARLLEVVAC